MISSHFIDSNGILTDQFLHGKCTLVKVKEEHIQFEKIQEDRSYWIEATCVRIMKRMKDMIEDELIISVMNKKCSFIPSQQNIQVCIDKLIEKEYFERDKKNSQLLHYLY